jgi:alkanesulfonate monooxygenase SsuD/methylene tetrahydromethanopterin reductase-like flavin-dependent oxidoreductase (luciferase family)
VQFGLLTLPNAPWQELARRWRVADGLQKVSNVWIADQLANPFRPEQRWRDAWTLLGALSQETTRVRIGPLVSPLPLRIPATLVNAVRTLDQLSDGRAELGVGAGGAVSDHELAQVENWEPAERARRFDKFVTRIVELEPSVPLTIGGNADTALRLAAKHAHRWNTYVGRDVGPAEGRRTAADRNARLDELCADTGRTVIRSALIGYPFVRETPFRSDDAWHEFVGAWEALGFDELVLYYPAHVGMPEDAVEEGLLERMLS